ncbi:hypothetical protein [Methylosinus sp. PW1]|uniref:hypothetical protein n=1 Tax=Methylosinus sp. PW1 TaxID=107636 RepID=UPI00055C440F|nr:hypothetical protein [Methylosinus sp. PW1]
MARLYSDQIVGYWRKGMRELNFGDALSELLYRELTKRSMRDRRAGRYKSDFDVVRLIGSVISDHQIEIDLSHSRADRAPKIAFWCCGKRDPHPLSEELQRHCVFLGARGPLTRDALGLPAERRRSAIPHCCCPCSMRRASIRTSSTRRSACRIFSSRKPIGS